MPKKPFVDFRDIRSRITMEQVLEHYGVLQPGQLSAAGGAAPVGATLDADDAAGEVDQNRGQGGAPFKESGLPDGRGGSAARAIPLNPSGNRPPAPARRGQRMTEPDETISQNG